MGAIIGIIFLLILIVPIGLYRAWVLTVMWMWFIVPLGLPEIGIAHAWGISMAIGMLTVSHVYKEDKEPLKSFANMIFAPLVLLGIGYIVHSFMG